MKHRPAKLELNRETIRTLNEKQLQRAAAAGATKVGCNLSGFTFLTSPCPLTSCACR